MHANGTAYLPILKVRSSYGMSKQALDRRKVLGSFRERESERVSGALFGKRNAETITFVSTKTRMRYASPRRKDVMNSATSSSLAQPTDSATPAI